MTQQCNYNKQRWRKEQWLARRVEELDSESAFSVSHLSDMTFPAYINDEMPAPVKTVCNIMIQVHWDKNYSISCWSQDLILLRRQNSLITVNNLNFERFILMLKKELKYNDWWDMIMYEHTDVAIMHILNELEWKTVLLKMHTERSIHFFFTIRRRTWRIIYEFDDLSY